MTHPFRRALRAGLVALALLAAAGMTTRARAHEYWLAASNYAPASGDSVSITSWVGTGFRGEGKRWNPARCLGFRLIDGAPRSLATAADNDSIWARITPRDDQGALLAYVSNYSTIELPAEAFDRYLALEGLDGPLKTRRAAAVAVPGRERYRRCCKVWLAGRSGTRYGAATGQPIELVPLSDPTRDAALRFRLDFEGDPLAGALVRVWRQPLRNGLTLSAAARDSVPALTEARTAADGIVTLKLHGPGEYLVSAVHMIESRNVAAADWESSWASFTFARPR